MYWNPEIETLDAESIAKIQSRKLRAMLRMVYHNHPHYRPLLRSQGVDILDVAEPGDLRRLPFTTQEALAADPESFVLPLPGGRRQGRLSARMQVFYDSVVDGNKSDRRMYEYHPVMAFESSARWSAPYRVYIAAFDKAIFKEVCGRSAICAGLSKSDRILNAQSPGQGIGFWSTVQGALSRGAVCSSPGRLEPAADAAACAGFRPTVIAGDPVYLCYLARAAERDDVRLEGLEKVFISDCPTDAGLRDMLLKCMDSAGASPELVDLYSVTAAKCSMAECCQGSGYHMNSDIHVWECLDPETGEPVGPGEPGELAFTSIDGRGSVFLRYRTGDVAAGGIVRDKCPHCGRTMPRIMGPLKRASAGPDPGQVARRLIDVEGIYYADVRRAPDGAGAKLTVYAVPDDASRTEALAGRIRSACGDQVAIQMANKSYV